MSWHKYNTSKLEHMLFVWTEGEAVCVVVHEISTSCFNLFLFSFGSSRPLSSSQYLSLYLFLSHRLSLSLSFTLPLDSLSFSLSLHWNHSFYTELFYLPVNFPLPNSFLSTVQHLSLFHLLSLLFITLCVSFSLPLASLPPQSLSLFQYPPRENEFIDPLLRSHLLDRAK